MFVLGRDMYLPGIATVGSGSGNNVVAVVISTGSDAFRWIQGRRLRRTVITSEEKQNR
jgi:hypothetical protein